MHDLREIVAQLLHVTRGMLEDTPPPSSFDPCGRKPGSGMHLSMREPGIKTIREEVRPVSPRKAL